MSVIPLITEGPARTVVQRQEDFHVEQPAALITNLDVAQLEDLQNSNASYDLRIGKKYRDHREQGPREIPEKGVITLNPGSAFIIQTEEYVHLPRRMFGIIAPKVSLLQRGLSTTFSKVDPGYYGHLQITLFNLGQTVCKLNHLDSFCAFTLLQVGEGARVYQKPSKQIDAQPAKQPRQHWREWLQVHHIEVIFWLAVVEGLHLFWDVIKSLF